MDYWDSYYRANTSLKIYAERTFFDLKDLYVMIHDFILGYYWNMFTCFSAQKNHYHFSRSRNRNTRPVFPLCLKSSLLAPVSLRPLPQNILFALIGQLIHIWASITNSKCATGLRLCKREIVWNGVMSRGHRGSSAFCGREELLLERTLTFYIFKIFYMQKNI